MSVSGSTRFVDVKLRSLMESAVTAKEFLEKEGLEVRVQRQPMSNMDLMLFAFQMRCVSDACLVTPCHYCWMRFVVN